MNSVAICDLREPVFILLESQTFRKCDGNWILLSDKGMSACMFATFFSRFINFN